MPFFAAAIAALSFCFPVTANNKGSAFDYSAEKMECILTPPALNAEEGERNKNLLGEVTDLDWAVGPENALLTIIEYADFQCPYCADASLSLLEYQKKHSDDVRLVYRHFPLSFHEKAVPATLAANAAGYQGMFFEAEHFLFEKQSEWSALPDNNAFTKWLISEFRKFSDLDFDLWYLAFSDTDNEAEIRNMYSQVVRTGIVNGTPTVFLNYNDSEYMFDDSSLDELLEKIRGEEKKFSECPDVVISKDVSYTAVLETDAGDFHIQLFSDKAPDAVNSFKFLAETGWFDGISFLNSEEDFLIRTESAQNPGYSIAKEHGQEKIVDGPGYIGISDSSYNAGSFFITYDLPAYYKAKALKDIGDKKIEESMVDKYAEEKMIRFSKYNTIFGRIIQDDMERISLLNNGTGIIDIKVFP